MGSTRVERGTERTQQTTGLDGEKGRDQDQVDQVLDTGTGMAADVAAGIGRDLLGPVVLEWKGGDLDRRDLRKAEEARAAQPLRLPDLRIAEADVNGELLEPPPGHGRRDVIAHGGTSQQLVELSGPLDGEPE